MNEKLLLWIPIVLLTLSGCSLILDRRADQCASDGDCARFEGTRCDSKSRLCVTFADDGGPSPGNDASSNAEDAPTRDAAPEADAELCRATTGCFQCVATTDLQLGTACTDASCQAFDNRSRLKNLRPDGGLLPLPDRDAGGP